MTTDAATYRLMTWLSPSFPVGAYSFSHGLEQAIADGGLDDAGAVQAWLTDLIASGSGQSDLVFAAAGWCAAADSAALAEANSLALAFCGAAELRLESTAQGRAFVDTIASAWPCDAVSELRASGEREFAYPVAVGAVARSHDIALEATLTAYAHGFVANLVSAAVRLVPLGQTDGQRITARLAAGVAAAVARAIDTPVERVNGNTLAAEIGVMRHEQLYTRLFRS